MSDEEAVLDAARQFIRAVALGEWEHVRALAGSEFVTSEAHVKPERLVTPFRGRTFKSVAPVLAEEFVAGTEEMGLQEMIDDLDGHYELFTPQGCAIDAISLEADCRVVYRATHTQRHDGVYMGMEPTGDEIVVSELGVLGFDGGEVQERRVSWDLDQFQVQLGIRPGQPDTSPIERGTQVRVHQQFHRVLNRILRHNIRNDLATVRSTAEEIATRFDEAADQSDRIVTVADGLLETTEKARQLEDRVLRPFEVRPVDIGKVVEALVEQTRRAHPDSELTVERPAGPVTLRSNRAVLELVLREAVENAIEHNESAEPRVEIRVSTDDEDQSVVVTIADDGPGIPNYELTPVMKGRETSLEHASGIGLWMIKWGVEQLGGRVAFKENDPQGSVVRLTLTDLESPERHS